MPAVHGFTVNSYNTLFLDVCLCGNFNINDALSVYTQHDTDGTNLKQKNL